MRVRVGLSFLITGVFLYLAIQNVHWDWFVESLLSANYWFVIPAAIATMTGYVLRTVRWGKILSANTRISFGHLFPALIIGFAANNILPARIGELVRAYTLNARDGTSRSLTIATVFVERMFDGFTLLAFMGIVLALAPGFIENRDVQSVAYVGVVIFLLAPTGAYVLIWRQELARRLVGFLSKPMPPQVRTLALRMLDNFILGLAALRHGPTLFLIAMLSVLVWALEGASYFLIMQAFRLDLYPVEHAFAAIFVLVFVNLGIMLPSAPGYIGTFQFFAKLALSAFGIASSVAFSIAVLSHAMQYVLVTSIGLLAFVRQQAAGIHLLSSRAIGSLANMSDEP